MKKIISVIVSIASKPAALIIFVIAVLGGTAVYSQVRYQKAQEELKTLKMDSQARAVAETEALIEDIKELTDLPENEFPTVATVSDAELLRDQIFFRNVQNGDKVLVYTQSERAVLYRPSTNKIIEAGHIDVNRSRVGMDTSEVAGESVESGTEGVAEPEEGVTTVVVYNGMPTDDTDDAIQKLRSVGGIEIVLKEDAVRVYDDTTVVTLEEGSDKDVLGAVLDTLGAKEGDLPEEEETPDVEADLLVILGKNLLPDEASEEK